MRVDLVVSPGPLRAMQDLARRAEAAGYAGLVVTELGRTAYLSIAAAATVTEQLEYATGIAVAFPRSPMVTAQIAWELADATGGRFRLGLGSQVKPHVERRFGVPFDPPGPRLREYVHAVRAIFAAFAGDAPLDVAGEFYRLDLLSPQWSPGPIAAPAPKIDISAVNPWMLRMAGAVADGVHVHPLNTAIYLRETVMPSVAAGASEAQRPASAVALLVPCSTVVGDSEQERRRWRELARNQVAFYGSTPNYAFIFEQLGYEGTTARIRERQKAGDLAGMAAQVSDELLAHFVVEGTWDELPSRIAERYRGAERVLLYTAGMVAPHEPEVLERFGEVARRAMATAA